MKKSIIAIVTALTLCSTVHAATYDLSMEEVDEYAQHIIDRKGDAPKWLPCNADVTLESNGMVMKYSFIVKDDFTMQGDERMYHDEDDKGSTTIYVNEKTGRGSISIMNEHGVFASGVLSCNK